jgi:LacI family transcriptional regulator
MSNKVKISQIADAAGVSPSTVDRVLNERGGVSGAKEARVIQAAKQLGFGGMLPSASHGLLRFDFVRPDLDTPYYHRMDDALQHHAQLAGPRVVLSRTAWAESRRQHMLDFIRHPAYRRHGLIVHVEDKEDVREALRAVVADGVPVIVLCNDVIGVPQSFYVGINHYSAGRTAALMASQMISRPGRVLLLTGGLGFHGHRQRAQGFLDAFQPRKGVRVDGPLVIYDNPEIAERLMLQAIAEGEPIVGIYNTGAASSAIRYALRHVPDDERPLWIAHEATEEHAGLVREGWVSLVIDQDPYAQAAATVQQLMFSVGERDEPPGSLEPRFQLVTAENWLARNPV